MATWHPIRGDTIEERLYYFEYGSHPRDEFTVEGYAVVFRSLEFPSEHPDHIDRLYVLQEELQGAFPYGGEQVEAEARRYASQHQLQFDYVCYGHANSKLHPRSCYAQSQLLADQRSSAERAEREGLLAVRGSSSSNLSSRQISERSRSRDLD